jgi:hypothetical protein
MPQLFENGVASTRPNRCPKLLAPICSVSVKILLAAERRMKTVHQCSSQQLPERSRENQGKTQEVCFVDAVAETTFFRMDDKPKGN